jgi:diaminopimelate epimerase
MKIPFTKMHGAGNDYVYVNGFALQIPDPAALARVVSLRRKGIGSDGLILVQPSSVAAVRMEMYNADGSRGEMCGNGIRCVGKYAWEHGLARENPLRVETDAGIKTLELEISNGKVRSVDVDMGKPILDPARIPVRFDAATVIDAPLEVGGEIHRVTCVSMGNPHCVLFVSDVDELDLAAVGPRFEHHERFPKRINTEFVQVLSPTEVRMRVWERGSGETAACGTGACAAAVAAALTRRTGRRVRVHLLGGDLDIDWRSDDHVSMRGEAVEVFTGELEVPA